MATADLTPEPNIFHLPITGKRNRSYCVVVAHALVLDDAFTADHLAPFHWHRSKDGYPCRSLPRDVRSSGQVKIYLHHLVYQHYHGAIPDDLVIDHINRNRLDNRPDNLRAVTQSVNCLNVGLSKRNTSGVKNVYWYARKQLWHARIRVNQKTLHLGYFATIEEAAEAVRIAQVRHAESLQIPGL